MNRRGVLPLVAVLLAGGPAAAQPGPAYQSELDFVRDLRARRYNDLALDYLKRLEKNNPTPELVQELPLEKAITRFEAAGEEPDSGRRLADYEQARADLEAFLAAKGNAQHPRRGEAQLAIARVLALEGRTQLSRALAQEAPETRAAEGRKARGILVRAGEEVARATKVLDAQIAALKDARDPARQAALRKLRNDRREADLALGLNLFDQGQTFSATASSDTVLKERNAKIAEAAKAFARLADADDDSPVTWQAQAWLGRCQFELGEPNKARQRFDALLRAGPEAEEGRRLSGYFRLLLVKESPTQEEKEKGVAAVLISEASQWLARYPSYGNTPEGYGVRFLLAQVYQEVAAAPPAPRQQPLPAAVKNDYLARARRLLRGVEQSENEYTDRARRLKIALIRDQKGFTRKVADLQSWEDCYVRAQYEVYSIAEDARPKDGKPAPEPGRLEELRKAHVAAATEALERGLKLAGPKPDPKAVPPAERDNARAMLAFYYLSAGKNAEAIASGEGFARDDPRSSQAAMAAAYALQAYAQDVARRERDGGDEEGLAAEREKMLDLARYMETRWPHEMAGDMARHQLGLHALRLRGRERDPAAATKLFQEGIAKLAAVEPSYPSYPVAQYQLAEFLLADKEAADAAPNRTRAVAALRGIPDSAADADPSNAQAYFRAKLRLATELFREGRAAPDGEKEKRFAEMDILLGGLLKKLDEPGLRLDFDPERAGKLKTQLGDAARDVALYAAYGKAEAQFARGKYAEAAKSLDALVDEFNAGKRPEVKRSPQLGRAVLGLALRADVQADNLKRAEAALKAVQGVSDEQDAAKGALAALQALAGPIKQQFDELQKKGDKPALEKAAKNFATLLGGIQADKLDTNAKMLLAECYSNMAEYKKSAELMKGMEEKGPQLLYARYLRLNKDTAEARAALDVILGTPAKPGWGARNVDAQLEEVSLLEEEGKFGIGAIKADKIVKQLLPQVTRDPRSKEKYLEAYYHVVYCFFKFGQGQADPAKKATALGRAARQAAELESKWPDYGSDASAKRFRDLQEKEPEFKEQLEQVRGK